MQNINERLTEETAEKLRAAIEDAGGNEVFAVGRLNEEGLIGELVVVARGDRSSVPALEPYIERGDVILHNHPSGHLSPSEADVNVAAAAGSNGVGSYIVDNAVERVYVIAEPARRKAVVMLDEDEIAGVLEPEGKLSTIIPNYEPRESQARLARDIVRAYNEGKVLAAEAGTGVGKSFAYLIPSFAWAIRNEERVVISTATINLQKQLIDKDIPVVESLFRKKTKAVLVKGRGNYLCWRRLLEALDEEGLLATPDSPVRKIADWAESTKTGDRADLSFWPEESVWSRVDSEGDSCLGLRCPYREKCFVLRVKREAADAQVVIANHHILFSDLEARMNGAGYESTAVLPPFRILVMDEAHSIEASATSLFSEGFNRFSVYKHLSRITRRRGGREYGIVGKLCALPGFPDDKLEKIGPAVQAVRDAMGLLDASAALLFQGRERTFRLVAAPPPKKPRTGMDSDSGRAGAQPEQRSRGAGGGGFAGALGLRGQPGQGGIPDSLAAEGASVPMGGDIVRLLLKPIAELERSILATVEVLRSALESAPDSLSEERSVYEAKVFMRSLTEEANLCGSFKEYEENPDKVFWLEKNKTSQGEVFIEYTATPLDIAGIMDEAVFSKFRSVICTSATLSVGETFDFWKSRVGLYHNKEISVETATYPSPFPFRTNALLAIDTGAPPPESPAFKEYVNRAVVELLRASRGRALVLFTAYDMLKGAYDASIGPMSEMGIACLRQGDGERGKLLETFKTDISSVLFATDSFWEGIDAPGETLSLVIICKLPFRVPTDPVQLARGEAVERRGGSSFMEISLPEAVIRLKQGFGRLIRHSQDRGAVVILDSRMVTKRYGNLFVQSLPPCKLLTAELPEISKQVTKFLDDW